MKIPGRWRPVLLVALGYGGFALLIGLFFRPMVMPRWHGQTSEQARYYEFRGEVNRAGKTLHAVAVRDSIVPLLPRLPGVVGEAPARVSSALSSWLQQRVRQEVGTTQSKAVVGVYVLPLYFGIHEALIRTNQPGSVILTGTLETPYCIVAANVRPPFDSLMVKAALSDADGRLVGPCGLWARYGAPGPSIKAWLDRGGYHFARRTTVSAYLRNDFYAPTLFGASQKIGDACLAGKTEACARGMLDSIPLVWRSDVDGVYPIGDRREYFMPAEAVLLYEVEEQFGAERFARFWTSNADVATAFKDSFGVDIGIWVRDWFGNKYGIRTAGPAVPAGSLALSLLAIGLLVGIAVRVGQRRHVG